MSKTPFLSFYAFLLVVSISWSQTRYTIDVELDVENQSLIVSQTITFQNPSEQSLSKIYLSDWGNSYQGTHSPLASHLANQFNRSFYLKAKSKLGSTSIQELQHAQKEVNWTRVENQLDLIEIELDDAIAPKQEITFSLRYVVKIPDDKFTGLGVNADNRYFLRNFFKKCCSANTNFENNFRKEVNIGFIIFKSYKNRQVGLFLRSQKQD